MVRSCAWHVELGVAQGESKINKKTETRREKGEGRRERGEGKAKAKAKTKAKAKATAEPPLRDTFYARGTDRDRIQTGRPHFFSLFLAFPHFSSLHALYSGTYPQYALCSSCNF